MPAYHWKAMINIFQTSLIVYFLQVWFLRYNETFNHVIVCHLVLVSPPKSPHPMLDIYYNYSQLYPKVSITLNPKWLLSLEKVAIPSF